jgi:ankyrin repeat protein
MFHGNPQSIRSLPVLITSLAFILLASNSLAGGAQSRADKSFPTPQTRMEYRIKRDLKNTNRLANKKFNSKNINKLDRLGNTPLIIAVIHGRTDQVRELLALGADPAIPGKSGTNPRELAMKQSNSKLAIMLLRQEIKNLRTIEEYQQYRESSQIRALFQKDPSLKEQLEELGTQLHRNLADQDPSLNQLNRNGDTPLTWAIRREQTPLIKILLEKRPDVNRSDSAGITPLIAATLQRRPEIFKLILERRPLLDEVDQKRRSALSIAATDGNRAYVEQLFEQGASAQPLDRLDLGAAWHAARNGHDDIAVLILKHQIDGVTHLDQLHSLELQMKSSVLAGITVQVPTLTQQLQEKSVSLHQGLAPQAPDLNLARPNKYTYMTQAISRGQSDLVKILLDKQVDMDSADSHRRTPLMTASAQSNPEIFEMILRKSATVNDGSRSQDSSLITAATHGYTEYVKKLIARGADLNLLGPDHLSAAQRAVKAKKYETANYIINRQIDELKTLEDFQAFHDTLESSFIVGLVKKVPNLKVHFLEKGVQLHLQLSEDDARLNTNNRDQQTLLTWAMNRRYEALAKILLEKHADADLPDQNGESAFSLATTRRPEFFDLVIRTKINALKSLKEFHELKSTLFIQQSSQQSGHPSGTDLMAKNSALKNLLKDKGRDLYLHQSESEWHERYPVEMKANENRTVTATAATSPSSSSEPTCKVCLERIPELGVASLDDDGNINKSGPAGCACPVCAECAKRIVVEGRGNGSGSHLLAKCPGCSAAVTSEYASQIGIPSAQVKKFAQHQVEQMRGEVIGKTWHTCGGTECPAGREVSDLKKAAPYSCAICDWEGCIKCKGSHPGGDCQAAAQNDEAMVAWMSFVLEQGKLAPLPQAERPCQPRDPIHQPLDKGDPYYWGLWRQCPHKNCGIMTERRTGCNKIKCGNLRCGKNWDWNRGIHEFADDYGDREMHPETFIDAPQGYETNSRPFLQ